MKILLALDESSYSEYAADVVLAREWPAQSTFKVVSVVEDSDSLQSATATEILLRKTALKLKEKFPAASITEDVLYGDCKNVLLECAALWRPDLIAVGTHGRRGLTRILLGSVSQAVLLYAEASVLIARLPKAKNRTPDLRHPPKRVLVPIDPSEHSTRVLDWILALEWPDGCHFKILTVLPPMVNVYSDGLDMLQGESQSLVRVRAKSAGKDLLEESQAKLSDKFRTAHVDTALLEGDAGDTILSVANSWPADLIVMGSRGHGTFKKLWLGSVSQEVVLQAPCPVEVVKRQS
ncbi:MAG TPA: universal stress protein [Oculatellaceae cyanobacterium]